MSKVKSVIALFRETPMKNRVAVAASLDAKQRKIFIGHVVKDATPAKAKSFSKLVDKRIAKAKAKKAASMNATGVGITRESQNKLALEEAAARITTTEGTKQVGLAVSTWRLVEEADSGSSYGLSLAYSWFGTAHWMLVTNMLELRLKRARGMDVLTGEFPEWVRTEEDRIQKVIEGCVNVIGYLMHDKLLPWHHVDIKLSDEMHKQLRARNYKELQLVPTALKRAIDNKILRAEMEADFEGRVLTEDEKAMITDVETQIAEARIASTNASKKADTALFNEVIEAESESIRRQLMNIKLELSSPSNVFSLTDMGKGLAYAMANCSIRFIDQEPTPQAPMSGGKIQHLQALAASAINQESEYAQQKYNEANALTRFLIYKLKPVIKQIEHLNAEDKLAGPAVADTETRTFGSNEQKEYRHGSAGTADGEAAEVVDVDAIEDPDAKHQPDADEAADPMEV